MNWLHKRLIHHQRNTLESNAPPLPTLETCETNTMGNDGQLKHVKLNEGPKANNEAQLEGPTANMKINEGPTASNL